LNDDQILNFLGLGIDVKTLAEDHDYSVALKAPVRKVRNHRSDNRKSKNCI